MENLCNIIVLNNNKITLKELAGDLGVSTTAISLALSGKGNLSSRMREYILSSAKKRGYTPSLQAQTILKKKIHIAVLFPAAPSFIQERFKEGIERAVSAFSGSKLECTIYEYETTDEHAISGMQQIIREKPDGAIFVLDSNVEEKYAHIAPDLNMLGIPIVSIISRLNLIQTACAVWIDAKKGGRIAADMLHLSGCTEALLLSGSEDASIHARYIEGFMQAAVEYKMIVNTVGYTSDNEQITHQITHDFFKKNPRKIGVFLTTCFSWSVCDALRELDMHVPVIGMDLLPKTREYLQNGQLTATICQEQALQASLAVDRVIEAVFAGNNNRPMEDIIIEPRLITRGYTFETEY